MTSRYTAPTPLAASHQTQDFASGSDILDAWLRRRALANQATGASRTFVVAQAERVAAYYCLAAAAVAPNDVTGRIRRNMPDPIPAVLLGRLAVDRRDQGRGLARGMVKDAVARTLQVSATLGVRCLVVNAISAEAARFWAGLGFTPSPGDPLLLSVTLQDAAAALGPA